MAWSDAICTALQLVNFWQDVAADWQRGRVYLPQEDLAHFRVAESDIASGRLGPEWRALMEFEVTRARRLLESGRPLTRALGWRQGLELAGVLAGGHRILDGIAATGGAAFRRRPQIGAFAWFPRPPHDAGSGASCCGCAPGGDALAMAAPAVVRRGHSLP